LLAFEMSGKGVSNVYSVRAAGTGLRLVLKNASSPSWSPDGKQLVVVRKTEPCSQEPCSTENEFDSSNLFVVDADGGNPRQLTFGADGADSPAWSPNGKWIAFMTADGVELIQPERQKGRRLVGVEFAYEFDWSPDGTWLAFVGDDGIYRMRPPSGEPKRLSRDEFAEDLAWSPDGSKIAFDHDLETPSLGVDVAVLDVETGRQINLTRRPGDDFAPAWSPGGTQIALLRDTGWALLDGCGWDVDGELWVMAADGTNLRRLAGGCYRSPAWGLALGRLRG
jgi:Tol biopolymer transport system component